MALSQRSPVLASIVVTTGPPAKAWTQPASPLQRCKGTGSPAGVPRKSLLGDTPGDRKEGTQWAMTVATLLSLQLGWGLWLMPSVYARLGYIPATVAISVLTLSSMYSGFLISRLVQAVNGTVLFGDVGDAAAGPWGRAVVYGVVYSLGATRCIILHLATSQSLAHSFAGGRLPLPLCGAVIAVVALVLVQVKSLSELGWLLSLGSAGQLFAALVVLMSLLASPWSSENTHSYMTGNLSAALISIMNLVFAYGGQFAFVEVITSMQRPAEFPAAVGVSTLIMGAGYIALGLVGYVARGPGVPDVIIFGIGSGVWARAACNAILVQALGQYLVSVNVWTHNILTLLARRHAALQGTKMTVQTSADHPWLPWLLCSSGVVAYSFLISMSVPQFSSLVALITSATYLTCAYTIPAWFTLLLLRDRISTLEAAACTALIPLSIAMSCGGLAAALRNLLPLPASPVS